MMGMVKKAGIWGGIITVLSTIFFLAGGINQVKQLINNVEEEISAPDLAARAAMERFIAINNNDRYFSYALNNPVEGDTLYVHWKWAYHTGGEYCYYYTIDGADIENSWFHSRIPGKCNPAGFSLEEQAPGFGFNSSIGVKLPYMIPEGNYTLTYYHLEHDGYHDVHQLWVTYDPIPFEVKTE